MIDHNKKKNRDFLGVNLDVHPLNRGRNFKYLVYLLIVVNAYRNEGLEVTKRIHVGLKNWHDMSRILYSKRITVNLKTKIHKTSMRLGLITETSLDDMLKRF